MLLDTFVVRSVLVTALNLDIVHQRTRHAATAPAVPFLAELALAPDTPRAAQAGWPADRHDPAGRHHEVLFPEPEQYAMLAVRAVPALRERAVEAIFARLATMPSLEAQPLVRNLKDLALKDLPDDPAAFPPLAKQMLGPLMWPGVM